MTINALRYDIADIIEKNVDLVHPNGLHVADLILKRIQETHLICEPSDAIRIAAAAIDHSTEVRSSWEGHVDRQSGAFTDQEIADSYTWR